MSRIAIRLDRLATRVPTPRSARNRLHDLSRLTDDELDRLLVLRERIDGVGPEGLAPDEMMDAAKLMRILEETTSR